jgi:hypothetical protein
MFYKTIYRENFLSADAVLECRNRLLSTTTETTELIDHYGVWKGHLVTTQLWTPMNALSEVFGTIEKSLADIIPSSFVIEKGQLLQSHLAYDIHTDYHIKVDHQAEPLSGTPYYTVIIPTETVDSHTVVFDQSADYNDFYLYKQKNNRLEHPESLEKWNQHCSHCWPEDREWLTIESALPWQQGSLIAFDRKRFHCSDNFTKKLKQKEAFVLWIRHR